MFDWKKIHEQAEKETPASAEALLKKSPAPVNRYLAALVFLKVHENEKAGQLFTEVLAGFPESPEARWGLAEVMRCRRNYAEAEKTLAAVLREKADFPPALVTLAYLKFSQKRYGEAARIAQRVIRMGTAKSDVPNLTRSYLIYAGAKGMLTLGFVGRAVNGPTVFPNLEKARRLNPDMPAVHYGLGSFYLLAPKFAGGSLTEAEKQLKIATELDPLFADAYARLAQLFLLKKNRAKCEEYLKKALETDPENELAAEIASLRSQ